MKALILKLSIFLSILTILYLILSYFGVLRNISLFTKNTRDLAEKYRYKTKSNFCKNNKIIIVVYSKNPASDKLKCAINSILDQTVKVDSVLLVTNNQEEIPQYLKYVVTPLPIDKDYGYGNKIIPPMLKEKEKNVIILPIENKIYGNDYVETLLEKSQENPDCQIFNQDNDLVLYKINNFSNDIISRDNKIFDKKWFNLKSKNKITLEYDDIKKDMFS
jgi:hypothetical protein